MTKGDADLARLAELRKRAEARLEPVGDIGELSPERVRELAHELQTHQIELEMQNEELRRAQEELIESRDRYSDLYEFAPVGYATVSDNGLILKANLALADMLAVERGHLVNQRLSAFIIPDDEDVFYLHRRQLQETEGRQACELRMQRNGGETFWAKMESVAIRDATGFRTAISDVTARKQAEEGKADIEQQYRAIVEDQSEFIARFRPDGTVTFVNEAACRFFGKSREELIGHAYSPYVHPDDRDLVQQQLASLTPGSPFETHENRGVLPTGEIYWGQWTNRGIFDEAGNLIEIQAVGRDVTERKQAEEALQTSEQQLSEQLTELETICSSSPVGLCFVDTDLRYVRINEPLAAINGKPASEHIGKTVREMLPELAPSFEPIFRRVIQTGQPVLNVDVHGASADRPDEDRDWQITYFPVKSPEGTVLGANWRKCETGLGGSPSKPNAPRMLSGSSGGS